MTEMFEALAMVAAFVVGGWLHSLLTAWLFPRTAKVGQSVARAILAATLVYFVICVGTWFAGETSAIETARNFGTCLATGGYGAALYKGLAKIKSSAA